MTNIPGQEVIVTLDNPKHWVIDTSIALNTPIAIKDFHRTENIMKALSVFNNVKNLETILAHFENKKVCKISNSKFVGDQVFVALDYKLSKLDQAVDQIKEITDSRVWVLSNPDRFVDIIVDSPWDDENLFANVLEILRQHKLKIVNKSLKKKKEIRIPNPFDPPIISSDVVDDVDKEWGKKMLRMGYFSPERPKGLTLEKIAEEFNTTKPTLLRHVRRMEKIGIAKLLGFEEIDEHIIDLSAKLIEKKLRKNKLKKN